MPDDIKLPPEVPIIPGPNTFRIEISLDNAGQLKVEAHGLADGWTCASILLSAIGAVLGQIKAEAEKHVRIVRPPLDWFCQAGIGVEDENQSRDFAGSAFYKLSHIWLW
jgi:hypothetical protein